MSKVQGTTIEERTLEAARLVLLDECIEFRECNDASDWACFIEAVHDHGKHGYSLQDYARLCLIERFEAVVDDYDAETNEIRCGRLTEDERCVELICYCFGGFECELWDEVLQLLQFDVQHEAQEYRKRKLESAAKEAANNAQNPASAD